MRRTGEALFRFHFEFGGFLVGKLVWSALFGILYMVVDDGVVALMEDLVIWWKNLVRKLYDCLSKNSSALCCHVGAN